jgi:hypothetical protein
LEEKALVDQGFERIIEAGPGTVLVGLWKAFGIPLAPKKQYFKFIWTHHTFALLFGPLPKKATCINVIESLLPGDHFNFREVDFSNWCTIPQAIDLPISTN